MPLRAPLVALVFLVVLFSGCLGGSDESCVPLTGDAGESDRDAAAIGLYSEPTGPGGKEEWPIIVQCNTDPAILAAYRFVLDTGQGRTIEILPNGTWTSPAYYYGPTNGTEQGEVITAQAENPGDEGDPTYRIAFFDEDANGLLGEEDRIVVTYDAGSVGTTVFESPLEEGSYRFQVFEREAEVALGEATNTFDGAF